MEITSVRGLETYTVTFASWDRPPKIKEIYHSLRNPLESGNGKNKYYDYINWSFFLYPYYCKCVLYTVNHAFSLQSLVRLSHLAGGHLHDEPVEVPVGLADLRAAHPQLRLPGNPSSASMVRENQRENYFYWNYFYLKQNAKKYCKIKLLLLSYFFDKCQKRLLSKNHFFN